MKPADRFALIQPSPIREIMARADELQASAREVARFDIGRPDFDSPGMAKAAVKKALDEGRVHYATSAGLLALRQAVARDFERYSVAATPDQVIITNGATQAIHITLLSILNPGDEVIVPEPSWPYYASMVRLMGGLVRSVPMRKTAHGFSLDLDGFANALTKRTRAVVVNSPNNPTGAVASASEIRALADFAQDHDLLIISDEVYDRFVFDGARHHSPAALPSGRNRTAVIGAASKTYSMTGWRIGYAILPRELLRPALLAHTYTNVCINTFSQHGVLAALEGASANIDAMHAEYAARRSIAQEAIGAMGRARAIPSQGTFYLFVEVDSHLSDVELAHRLLEEAHVATVPGSVFGASGAGHLRLSIACKEDSLRRGLARMADWMAGH